MAGGCGRNMTVSRHIDNGGYGKELPYFVDGYGSLLPYIRRWKHMASSRHHTSIWRATAVFRPIVNMARNCHMVNGIWRLFTISTCDGDYLPF